MSDGGFGWVIHGNSTTKQKWMVNMSIDRQATAFVIRRLAKIAAYRALTKTAQPGEQRMTPRQVEILLRLGMPLLPGIPSRIPPLPANFPNVMSLPTGAGFPLPVPIRHLWDWRRDLRQEEIRGMNKAIEDAERINMAIMGLIPNPLFPQIPPQAPVEDIPNYVPVPTGAGLGGHISVPLKPVIQKAWPGIRRRLVQQAMAQNAIWQKQIDEHNKRKTQEFDDRLRRLGFYPPPPDS